MGDRDHGGLLAPTDAELREVGVERLSGAARVLGGFAEHGAQLGGAAFGDASMPVAIAGLVRGRDEPGVAGDVLGTREAGHVGQGGDEREGHDRAHAGEGLKSRAQQYARSWP